MSVRDFAPGKEILSPRGMWTLFANKRKGTPERASFMQNCRVSPGTVGSRPGTSPVALANGKVTGLSNWITPANRNLVLYQENQAIVSLLQSGGLFTPTNLVTGLSPQTRRPTFADLDIWNYFAGYDILGNGTFQARIFDGTNVDIAFRGPVTLTAASAVDGGAGQCTAGTHFIGFIYQSRSGFAGKPTTTVGSAPISVTLAAGLRQINVSVTLPALPDGGGNATLYLIMTRADQSATWYYMPTDATTGAVGDRPVPFNTPVTLNFVASLSDEDIADDLAGDTANDNFLLLTQDAGGNGPFVPSFTVAYGQRMCYGVGTTLYISNINDPQYLTGDQHVITTPNQRSIAYAFPLPGSSELYLTGDRWTSRVTDNSDVPATWSQPIKVSDSLGAPFPACVCARTGGAYAWIVTEAGPYLFTGTYASKPLTYMVGDQWERVNWNAAYAIEIADDVVGLKLYIAVPIDGATEPNALFVIDYQAGMSYEAVDISLDFFSSPTPFFSSVGVIKEQGDDISDVWIGPGSAGTIRHFDAATHNDYGVAVSAFWESGLVRGKAEFASRMIRVAALDIWARGNGQLQIVVFGPDHVKSVTPLLSSASGVFTSLSPTPGNQYQAKFDLSRIENYSVRFGTNGIDQWFELSGFTGYTKADLFNR